MDELACQDQHMSDNPLLAHSEAWHELEMRNDCHITMMPPSRLSDWPMRWQSPCISFAKMTTSGVAFSGMKITTFPKCVACSS